MGLRSLTGKPTYYPDTNEMSEGEVIFEKATLVEHAPSKNYPNSTNFFFDLPEAVTTDKGTTDRLGISAGQITKAIDKLLHQEGLDTPTDLYGRDFRLVYEGSNVLTKGPFKGKSAKAFTLQVYEAEESTATPTEEVNVEKVVAAQEKAKSGAGDSLDDMMN